MPTCLMQELHCRKNKLLSSHLGGRDQHARQAHATYGAELLEKPDLTDIVEKSERRCD
jgi:hypothetical protein